MPVQVAFT